MSFTVPTEVRAGSTPVQASQYNTLVRAIRELQAAIRAIPPTKKAKESGSAPNIGGPTIVPLAFRAESSEEEDTKWYVKLSAAKLWEMSLSTEGKGHSIKLPDLGEETGRKLDEPAEIELEGEGENKIWLKYKLKKECEVEEDSPEILITVGEDDDPEGAKFIPDWDDSGQDGEMIQHLGTITVEEGKAPTWKPVSPHAIVWALTPGINYTGGNHSIISEYDDEAKQLKLRGIEQMQVDSDEEAKHAIDVVAGAGTDIQIRQVASRPFEGTEDVEEDEIPGGEPQIVCELSALGNAVIVRGNGYNRDAQLPGGWNIQIRDGLIQELTLQ